MLSGAKQNVKYFGSRGQQRLVVLQQAAAADGYRSCDWLSTTTSLDDIFFRAGRGAYSGRPLNYHQATDYHYHNP